MPDLQSRALAPATAAVVAAASLAAWFAFPAEALLAWMDEGRAVESATIALYLGAAALLVAAPATAAPAWRVPLLVVLLAFAAREGDWHLRFTDASVLRVSWYLGPAPGWHKAVALAVLLPVAGALAGLARLCLRGGREHGWQFRPVPVTVLTFLVVMGFAKVVDRSLSVLAEAGLFAGGPSSRALQVAIEEPLELALPLLAITGLLQQAGRRRATSRAALPRGARGTAAH